MLSVYMHHCPKCGYTKKNTTDHAICTSVVNGEKCGAEMETNRIG